jgi:DNA-binding MarR family transcriptional regulator
MSGSSSGAGRPAAGRPLMFPRRWVLVQLTDQRERLAEESLHAAIAADEAFLEPLSARQRDSAAVALKQFLLRSAPS